MTRIDQTTSSDTLAAREIRIIERLVRAIIRKQETGPVLQGLAEELVSFGFRATIVTEFDEGRNGFRILGIAPRTRLVRLISDVLRLRIGDYVFPFSPKANKVLSTLANGKVWIGRSIGEVVKPAISPRLALSIQKIMGIQSIYNSPLMSEDALKGSVIVGSEAKEFSAREKAFLDTITHHAALLLHQARLLAENKRKAEQYQLLGQVDRHILEERQLEKVLSAIVENIHNVLPCDLAGIYLLDPSKNELRPAVTSGRKTLQKRIRTFVIPHGKGILGSVAKTRKAAIVNNAHKDRRSVYPGGKKPEVEHLLCVPLVAAESMLGVLHLGRFHDEPFAESDLEIAQQFGEKSALAVENAKLFQRQWARQQELEALHRSGVSIAESLSLPKVTERILEHALSVIPGANHASLFLVDEKNQDLTEVGVKGGPLLSPPVWGKGTARKAIVSRQIHQKRARVGGIPSIETAVPLVVKNQTVGLLFVGSSGVDISGFKDTSLLDLFALHSALALSNALSHGSVFQEVKKIKLLREIKDLAGRRHSTNEYLQQVCNRLTEAYGYHLATVLLYDKVRALLTLAAASGEESPLVSLSYTQSDRVGVVGWVARNKKMRVVHDASRDRDFINPNNLSTRSELCTPILSADGELVGVINTESNRVHAFSDADLQLHVAVAAEIAGAFAEQSLLEALRNSEHKFRKLFEESKDAIYISTPGGKILDVNHAAISLFGFESKEEMVRTDIARDLYVHPSDRLVLVRDLEKFGFLKDVELRLKRKNGSRIIVYATITVNRDASGGIVSYQGILRDVTKQKEAEHLLHESEEKYRSLVEDALVGVYIIQDNALAFVNRKFAEMFGYSVQELLQQKVRLSSLVHPQSTGPTLSDLQTLLTKERRSLRVPFKGIRKSGEPLDGELYGTVSVYRGHAAVIGTILDRTQELRQQKEISDWRQRYELIIASSGQIVYEYDVRSGMILWGGTIEKVLGYSLMELRGDITEWEGMIHPDDRNQAVAYLDDAMARMAPYDVEYRYRKKDGSYAWMHDRGFFLGEDGKARVMLGMMEDISAQRELEERVRASELKHRLLFEHSIDGILVLRGETIIDCNPRALELFGCGRKDLVGQSLYAFSPPYQLDGVESRKALLSRIEEVSAGTDQSFTWRHVRRDGSPFEADLRLTRFELGSELLLQAQIRDISSELAGQEELARSEEKYRQLILEAGDAILVLNGSGKIVEANEKACHLLRYTREELLRQTVAAISPLSSEDAIVEYRRLYGRLIEAGSLTTADDLLKRKDGTLFPYEMNVVLLGNGLLQAIVRDISEKKRAEQELDQIYGLATTFRGTELFEKAATALAELLEMDYVLIGEVSDRGARINPVMLYDRGELRTEKPLHAGGTPFERIITTGESVVFEDGVKGHFSENPLLKNWNLESLIGSPLNDSNRSPLGIVVAMGLRPHQFTDHERKILSIVAQRLASEFDSIVRRKREEHLSQQLMQSQKMESLGTLAGGVAHDFNNILGAVIGYTSLIKKQTDPQSQIGRYLEAIDKSAQRAASLSKQLLSFSHKTHGDIRHVSINDLIDDTVHIITSSFPKHIGIKKDFSEALPPVLGDQNQLAQVIMNLCINARDAIEEHKQRSSEGQLTISTSHFQAGAGFIDVHLSAAPGEYVCITVRDNGIGMPPEVRQRIFEPFYTTKAKGRGTGLGLSMVYGIVRNHGGFIDVYSEEGKGTEFKIFLPGSQKVEKPLEEIPEEDLPRGNGEVVMIVDDEPMLRELVADVLAGQGYGVVVAANGKEALELYDREKDRVRLVILDMIMPEMDGPATFQALKSVNPDIKVLICSGFSQDSSVQVLLHRGAAGFVGKPYQTEDLLKAVSDHLSHA